MTDAAPPVDRIQRRGAIATVVLGLFIAYLGTAAWFVVGAVVKETGVIDSRLIRQVIGLSWAWVLAAALVLYVVRFERRPLSSIGVRGTRWTGYALTPVWWLIAIALSVLMIGLLLRDVDTSAAQSILDLPVWVKVSIVITASVTEEVLFRAYPIERLADLTGRVWLAGVIAAAVFVVFHMPAYGILPGLARAPGSIVMTIVYIRRRSLGPVIVLHAMFDVPIVFVS